MTDNERDFEDFIGDVKFDDTPNHAHRDRFERDLAAAVAKQTRQKDQSPRVWRIIMKGRITKAASAAIIILAAVLTITVLNRSESAAWAIDQTIKALEKYDSLYVSGVFCDEKGVESGFDLWARPHSEDPTRSGDFRIEVKDKEIAVAIEEENITYRHDPQKNTVLVLEGLQNSVKPFWPGSSLFRELKENAKEW